MAARPTNIRAPTKIKTAPAPAPTTTRSTRSRTATATTKPVVPAYTTSVKKTAARKPFIGRDNLSEAVIAPKLDAKQTTGRKRTKKQANIISDADREPIMAYLRIRPHQGDIEPSVQPYLTPLTDTSVRMTDPNDQQKNPTRFRLSTLSPASTYTFSHVFLPETFQTDFFTKTTLPLVHDVLQGQNGLLFAYGVTNSGKTYTIQGGVKEGSAGILPRTLDVIFNSIEGLHGDGRFRPVRLQGVESADPDESMPAHVAPEPALAAVFGQHLDSSPSDLDIDPTVLKVDRNYEYTVWLSYAEVYNEKVYDLLDSIKDHSSHATSGIPRPAAGKTMLLSRSALPLKPSPASDHGGSSTMGKYISGLRQFRVHSASHAKALVKLGQLHRRVFGTLANSESSRSHGMVIIKVVRGHRGERDDPTAVQISRLTLVDLAGSERTKHTHTTGDRLREAGNINKSLMVLGQCMEVMRSNQRKLALSLSQEDLGADGTIDTRDVRKGFSVVPFRHSKLTEALMDYFTGNGRAVMIVNVNPYDTGYDENSHVMRFAALAREVYVTPAHAPIQRVPSGIKGPGKSSGTVIKELGPLTLKDPDIAPNPYRRKVTISIGGPSGERPSEAILEVLEEDEPNDTQDEDGTDDEPINPLVDALFDEVEYLRLQLFESEMRCAIVEAETREEVMHEMEARMRGMEDMYSRRLMKELEQNELKTNAKIDMLHQSGLFGSPVKKQLPHRFPSDLSAAEEEDVEMSLMEGVLDIEEVVEDISFNHHSDLDLKRSSASLSPSLAKHNQHKGQTLGTQHAVINWSLPQKNKETSSVDEDLSTSNTTRDENEGHEDEIRDEYIEDFSDQNDEEDEWIPPSANYVSEADTKNGVDCLTGRIDELSLTRARPDNLVATLPVKKKSTYSSSYSNHEEVVEDPVFRPPAPKKKKRQLGKNPIMTEDQIERATYAAEQK